MRRLGVAIACLMAIGGKAYGFDDTGKSPIWSFHITACGQYVEDRKLPQGFGANATDRIYVAGWLSALNAVVKGVNIQDESALDNVMLWLDHYCANNPFSTLQIGLMALSHEIAPHSVQTLSESKEK